MTFDLDAFRAAHPEATPADAQAAHREAIEDDLHDQFLALLAELGPSLQLAILQGKTLRVGVQVVAPEETATPTFTGPHLVTDEAMH